MQGNKQFRVDRRAILSALGLGFGSTFLPSLSRQAHAATPKRILFMISTHQQVPDHWRMTFNNAAKKEWTAPLATTPDSAFSPVLKHFAPYKDRTLILDGMSQLSGIGRSSVNNHDAAVSNLMTGAGVDTASAKLIQGASIDQLIADHVQEAGRLRSIELGTFTYAGGFVASAKNQRLPVIKSLPFAFSTLFSNIKPASPSGTPLTETDKILAARQDAVAAAKDQLAIIRNKLSKSDQERMGAHLEFVNKYESLLSPGSQASCSALPTATQGLSGNNEAFFTEMGRLVAHAFACDAVRVATIQMGDFQPDSFGGSGSVHDTMAHNNGSASGIASLRKYNLAAASAVARVVGEMAKLNLLDSTLVVWLSEHGLYNEPHRMDEMPVVMVGNVDGHFKTGRYISVARTTRSPRGDMVGVPHNKFLVSLLQSMGSSKNFVNIESWQGTPLTGPLPNLT